MLLYFVLSHVSSLVQAGCQCNRFLWPASTGPPPPRFYSDPPAAWRGRLLRRLQHWTFCPQLLPVCTSHARTNTSFWLASPSMNSSVSQSLWIVHLFFLLLLLPRIVFLRLSGSRSQEQHFQQANQNHYLVPWLSWKCNKLLCLFLVSTISFLKYIWLKTN